MWNWWERQTRGWFGQVIIYSSLCISNAHWFQFLACGKLFMLLWQSEKKFTLHFILHTPQWAKKLTRLCTLHSGLSTLKSSSLINWMFDMINSLTIQSYDSFHWNISGRFYCLRQLCGLFIKTSRVFWCSYGLLFWITHIILRSP